MLTHPTLDQLHQLGLAGMARAFTELEANPQSAELSHAEWLALLLDREATERYQRRPAISAWNNERLRARLRYARLRHQAAVEDVRDARWRPSTGRAEAEEPKVCTHRWREVGSNSRSRVTRPRS